MIRRPITIQHDMDMEERPMAHLVQEAVQYDSHVYIETDDKQINAKSIMGMLCLELTKGTTFTVVAEGADEQKAVEGVEAFFATH